MALQEGSDVNTRRMEDLSFCHFVIDSVPVAVVAVDPELRITRFNPRAADITGYSEEEVFGSHCGHILRGGMCGPSCPLKTVIKSKKRIVSLETTIHNKKGDVVPVRMSTAGLFNESGELIGGVEAFQDISEEKARERERNNLISMFAHDMNSSLTGIHGLALRLLKMNDLNEEKSRKFIDVITKEAGKLESLVKDFLEFSRLQSGKLTFNFDATDLGKELYELFDLYEPKAAQNGVQLQLQGAESLPVIKADGKLLRRVFTNLLDNAIKFSEEGGTVTVSIEDKDDEVMVRVKDEGMGIPADELPYIFDLFHRERGAEKKEGYGVGLAIVKAIVEGHGGRVFVTSEVGQGTVFTLLLPKIRKLGE